MDDHVVFFFGSGVSFPSGMPDVNCITQKVLDGDLVQTKNKRYVFPGSTDTNPNVGRPSETSEEEVAKVQGFINTIWEHADTVLSQYGRHVTYEDLYALCGEVVTDQQETKSAVASVNPAIRHFTDALKEQLGDSLLDASNEPFRNLAYTANEANFLISGVVRELLSKSPDEVRGFDLLREAIDNLDGVTFVTLNHDLLLEQFLDENDIDFDDGFRKVNNGVEQYSPELLFDGPTDVTLIKPHGSINWYYDSDRKEYVSLSSIPPEPDLEDYDLRPEPSILSGYKKEECYTTGIFGDMVDAFVLALHDTTTVIESGFGWSDYGMDRHLRRYLARSEANQLLILHPRNDFSASHLFRGRFQKLPDNCHLLNEYLCEAAWDDVKNHITKP